MKEQEYINVSELHTLANARDLLRKVTPENSQVIDTLTYQGIMQQLSIWINDIRKKIDIKDKE